MHQRGIHRRRVRLRPRNHTRRGMRSDLKFNNKRNKECLRELEDNDPRMKFDMILKCFDMYCDRKYDMHCGEHTVIMKECINSYSFRAMLETCQERACELWKTQKIINVVCCCSQGIHRSVAIASIMYAVFLSKGYKACGPYHICKKNWLRNCICSDCPACMPSEEKSELIRAVISKC